MTRSRTESQCLPEQHVCIAEPLAFHFGDHVNKLQERHGLREQCGSATAAAAAAAARRLEILRVRRSRQKQTL